MIGQRFCASSEKSADIASFDLQESLCSIKQYCVGYAGKPMPRVISLICLLRKYIIKAVDLTYLL